MIIIFTLWVSFFVINFNIAMMIPLLPFIDRDIGLTSSEAGFILASFPIVALMSNLALGPIVDRYGRKRSIIVGAGTCAFTLLLTAMTHSPMAIILGRAVTGLFMPLIGASVFSAIGDYFPSSQRARIGSFVASAAPISFLCAISLGVFLGGLLTWRLPLILLACICFLLAIMAWALPPADISRIIKGSISAQTYRIRLLSFSSTYRTRLLLLSYLLWSAGMYTFLGAYPSWLVQDSFVDHGVDRVGLVLFIGELGGLAGALLSDRLAKLCQHPLTACAVASFLVALVIVAIPIGARSFIFQIVAYCLFALCRDLMLALILGGAMLLVQSSERGSLNGMLNALYQTGASAGGMASAWLYAFRSDFAGNAVVSFFFFIIVSILLYQITKAEKPKIDTESKKRTVFESKDAAE